MTRLPDAVLDRADGRGRRTCWWPGGPYVAASSWTREEEAKAAAAEIRAAGGLARTTKERRPLRSYGIARHESGAFRRPRTGIYMWLVWECEKHACAESKMEALAE